jgi:hypothetical protein
MSAAVDVLDPGRPKRIVITGQQQYSGRAAARLMVEALGI